MTRDMKAMRNGIIAGKPLLRHTITKETTKTSTRLELCSFIRRKSDKVSTIKKPEEISRQGFDHREARMMICCV